VGGRQAPGLDARRRGDRRVADRRLGHRRTDRAIAVPAIDGDDVLAVVELNSDREIKLGERLMRSLHGIAYELGHFLARRRAELGAQLLTAREVEILQHAAAGLTARMTAELLTVSPGTIRTHLENIYPKLDVSDKASAVASAIRLGIIT
jgi:DNA-binding NarL/FixJ family response regulator